MELKDILALEIPAARHSVLYLWTTAPKLKDGLQVLDAWGFKYRTSAVWDKGRTGLGYWFRGQHEHLLVGVRGTFSPPPPKLRTSSMINEPRGRHSEKPAAVRDLITGWFPDARRLEMFARAVTPGWDAWGNEVP